jgi:hypothetical protein
MNISISISVSNAIAGIKQGFVNTLINAFSSRVLTNGGTFEARGCLDAALTTLNNIL